MARDLYSIRIASYAALAGSESVTVPAGVVWILRDVDAVHVGTVFPARFGIVLGPGTNIVFETRASSADPQSVPWRGRQVFNPGDELIFETSGSAWDITASGYQLSVP